MKNVISLMCLTVIAGLGSVVQADVVLEPHLDAASFEARLGGVTNLVDFDDIPTANDDAVPFAADRYKLSEGIVITAGSGGQYVSRTFEWPADFIPVSAPNMYAPGPVGGITSITDVTFFEGEEPALVAGFGAFFIDADWPGIAPAYLSVYDAQDQLLGASGTVSGSNASQLFAGLVAVDADTGQLAPIIARVRLVTGDGWPATNDNEGVALDNFLFSPPVVPEPATLTLLGLGFLVVSRRRRAV